MLTKYILFIYFMVLFQNYSTKVKGIHYSCEKVHKTYHYLLHFEFNEKENKK